MKNKEINTLITGATGIVGREVFYELLAKYAAKEMEGKIYLLTRSCSEKSAEERIVELIMHPFAPDYLKKFNVDSLLKLVHVIDSDIKNINSLDFIFLKTVPNIHVIHLAGSTNLANNSAAEKEIYNCNYLSTMNLLDNLLPYISKFIFVSTAFASGHRAGIIENSFRYLSRANFRNPYEKYKLQTENEIIKICEQYGKTWQILRPSVVCGRLIETPLYFTPKFNVFYGLAKFASLIAHNKFKNYSLRISANINSGLNILPSDYVAKVITRVFDNNDIKELNISDSENFSMPLLISQIMNSTGFEKYVLNDKVSDSFNEVERLYYHTAGAQFTPYLNTPQHRFDTSQLIEIMSDLKLPDVRKNFNNILQFANNHNFKDL